MTSLTIAHAGPDFALMQWGSILVALFRGPITTQHIEIARPIAYDAIRDAHAGGALLTIFEPSAYEASPESRAVAASIFEDAGKVVRAVAVVYEGSERRAALLERSRDVLARAETSAKSAAFSEVGPAAKWVLDASGLGKDEREPDQLALAIARARKTLPAR